MPKRKQLDITDHMIWKDKNIKPETKEIFAIYIQKDLIKLYQISILVEYKKKLRV